MPLKKKKKLVKKEIQQEIVPAEVVDKPAMSGAEEAISKRYHMPATMIWPKTTCMNPIKFLEFNCPECLFYTQCQAVCKDDYGYANRRKKAQTAESEDEESSVMLNPPPTPTGKKKVQAAQTVPAPSKEPSAGKVSNEVQKTAPAKRAPLKSKSKDKPSKPKFRKKEQLDVHSFVFDI